VKTIKPEDIDRWDQCERAREEGWFPDNVIVSISKGWLGGEICHGWFAARARMLHHSVELEVKIAEARLGGARTLFSLAFCGDGFYWRQDLLEDFVSFYATGAYRGDDSFSQIEQNCMTVKNISLARMISRFAYFRRKKGEIRPSQQNWHVRPPREMS